MPSHRMPSEGLDRALCVVSPPPSPAPPHPTPPYPTPPRVPEGGSPRAPASASQRSPPRRPPAGSFRPPRPGGIPSRPWPSFVERPFLRLIWRRNPGKLNGLESWVGHFSPAQSLQNFLGFPLPGDEEGSEGVCVCVGNPFPDSPQRLAVLGPSLCLRRQGPFLGGRRRLFWGWSFIPGELY